MEFSRDRYDKMKFNRCGKSGLMLPAISLGLWHNFGGVDQFENSQKIVRMAFDNGITHFDLANNYGPPLGSAEENFGHILKKSFTGSLRDELIISTKAGYRMWDGPYGEWGSRKYLTASLDQSLRRMGLEYVDIFYSHRPDPDTPMEETMGALTSAVKQGKALYVGISSYSATQTKEACRILRENGTPCLIHQPRYSMFDRWVEDELLDILANEGIGCIPFSPLAQGMLTDRYIQKIPENSRAAKDHGFLQKSELTDKRLSQIRLLNEMAESRSQSLAQMAMAWVMRKTEITTVLIGVSSTNQLENNLGMLENMDFSDEELERIDQILD